MGRHVGYIALVATLILIAFGLIMLFSTGGRFATEDGSVVYEQLAKQSIWLLVGTICCVVVARTDYHWLLKWAPVGVVITLVLMALVFLFPEINGARRWIRLGSMSFQPSELGKLALLFFLAFWMGKAQRRTDSFLYGFLVPLGVTTAFAAITLRQNDFGMTAMYIFLFAVVMFCAGARLRYLVPIPTLGFVGLVGMTLYNPERVERWLAFLDPFKYRDEGGYQVWQSLIALGSGGTYGLGLGMSRQKHGYVPEPSTDMIFPIAGEELGLLVALGIVLTFVILTLSFGWIAIHADDRAGLIIGIGITTMVASQAIINLGVVTALLPTKGMPLPFISYGGSNLLVNLIAIGVMFNLLNYSSVPTETLQQRLPRPEPEPCM